MKNCKYFDLCGGCTALNIPYDEQLTNKSNQVKAEFEKYNINIDIPKTIGMFFPYKYRNKIHLRVKELKGKTIVGFFEEGSNKVVDVNSCLLHPDWVEKLLIIIKTYIAKYKIRAYDTLTKQGTIRYIVARVLDNDIMLTLVTTTNNFAGREYLYAKLKEVFKNVSLYVNINKRTDKLVFDSDKFKHLLGEKYLTSTICGVKYSISPNSFLQVNLDICKAMYQKAFEWLELNKNDNLLDLYSGIGITSIYFAKYAKEVTSIEYNKDATDMAVINKQKNSVENLKIFTGPCEDVLGKLDLSKFNKVFLDPARMGMEENTIKYILDSNIERMVYMSCSYETLARDIKYLSQKYTVEKIQTYDMFPQTHHVETLVCLQRRV